MVGGLPCLRKGKENDYDIGEEGSESRWGGKKHYSSREAENLAPAQDREFIVWAKKEGGKSLRSRGAREGIFLGGTFLFRFAGKKSRGAAEIPGEEKEFRHRARGAAKEIGCPAKKSLANAFAPRAGKGWMHHENAGRARKGGRSAPTPESYWPKFEIAELKRISKEKGRREKNQGYVALEKNYEEGEKILAFRPRRTEKKKEKGPVFEFGDWGEKVKGCFLFFKGEQRSRKASPAGWAGKG